MKRGCFISIEGVEGVGKSTAREYIESLLQARKIDFITTREPGGTPMAEDIRQLLLAERQEVVSSETELLLMFASRSQNVNHVILPALSRHQWVLADRFTDASLAYQGGGRGIDLTAIRHLAHLVQGDLTPDLTLLLDAPVSVGFERVNKRGHKDRIEQEAVGFFNRVRSQYLDLAEQEPKRFKVIQAELSLEAVKCQIKTVIESFFVEVGV